jgi:hypothetical protein
MVHSHAGTGVIILTEGKLTGAYTSDSRDISDSADGVLALCKDHDAVIEVKAAAPGERQPLDVDGVVGSRKVPTGTTQIGIPVYRPEGDAAAAAAPAPAPPAPSSSEVPVWQPDAAPAPAAPTNPAQPTWQPSTNATETIPTQGIPTPARPAADVPTQPGLPTPAVPEAAPSAPVPNVDWEAIVNELQAMTEDALGNRSRKVKDVLASAERSPAGLDAAIQQVPTISILFVDSSRLEALAGDLRTKLHSYLG